MGQAPRNEGGRAPTKDQYKTTTHGLAELCASSALQQLVEAKHGAHRRKAAGVIQQLLPPPARCITTVTSLALYDYFIIIEGEIVPVQPLCIFKK